MQKARGEGACASLEERLYLSSANEIIEISAKGWRHTPFSGAVSLCAGEKSVFCSDAGGAVWQLDRETMLERAVGSGGPGIRDMCLAEDERKLFSLLGDADSILLSDARDMRPLAVNCCGCNPQNLSRCGNRLAVSGGESGYVYIFSTHTLECIDKILLPGPVCSVLLDERMMYALCMTTELHALLVIRQGEYTYYHCLPGMPGCLGAWGEQVLIALQGSMYVFSGMAGCMLGVRDAPGCASHIFGCMNKIFLLDSFSECMFTLENGLPWRMLCKGVKACATYRGCVQ